MYQKSVLPNGLRVITAPMPHTRSATVAIFVGAGSRYEPDEVAGISHFIEHMLFKGTERRPTPREVSEEIEAVGGLLNAATDRELTVYWAKTPRPAFERTFDCLADMVRHSRFDPAEIEKERGVIIEELNMVHDSPQQLVDQLIDEVVWPDQPLGRDIAGTRETVAAITREQQLAYLERQYRPNNTVVSVAGNIEHAETVELATRLFGDWLPCEPAPMYPARDGQSAPRLRLLTRRTEQAHLSLAVRALDAHHPDRYALDLLNVILGEGMSSRLFQEIRENQGLAYDVHSYVSRFQDTGALTVYAGVDPQRIEAALEAVLAELRRFTREPVSERELAKAKDLVKGRLLLRLEDTRAVATSYGNQELLFGEILTADDLVHRIDQVTPDDIQRVATTIFRDERLNLAVVGNYRREERFRSLLRLA
ncbi:MAG: peptidase M16 [Dehalococcoidia bacterium]|nr:MAG: peptidase M16 [Dehalococcoidia bacterium]